MIGEDRRNQQHRISASGAGLVELIGAEDELLAEQGQIHHLTHLHQHLKTALEKPLIGEHRQAAGTTSGIGLGNGLGIKVFADHPFAGAGFFHLSNHGRLAAAGLQRSNEIAGRRQGRHLGFELLQRHPLTGLGDFTILFPNDLLKDVARGLIVVGNGVFQMGHTHLGVGRPATDFHGGAQAARAWAACL